MTRTALAAPEPADRFLYHRDAPVTLYLGDAHRVLSALPTASVDTVVTSPPYYGLRNFDVPGQYGLEPTPQAYVDAMVISGEAPFDRNGTRVGIRSWESLLWTPGSSRHAAWVPPLGPPLRPPRHPGQQGRGRHGADVHARHVD